MTGRPRIAVVVSHPIQHFVPLYRAFACRNDVEIKVFFAAKIGIDAYYDAEMATVILWAGDLLSGYDSEFLPGHARIAEAGFWSIDNPGVGRRLAAFQPSAVILYGYAQLTQLRAFAWCRRHGVAILMIGDGDNVARRPGFRTWFRAFVLRRLMRRVDAFLTVGDQNEVMLHALGVGREKMVRAPFSIDETTYKAFAARRTDERMRVRDLHGIARDALVLLFVGKMSSRKRPMDLIEAFRRLDPGGQDQPAIVMLFCGDGPERPALARAIERLGAPAVLAGFVNVDRLPGYFCAADVLVHPSEHDPHPLICSEAACIGLPMILSDRVGALGPTDIARAGENALVYQSGDCDGLAAAIARLRDDPGLMRRMAERSRAIYDACDMDATIRGVLRATDKVCYHTVFEDS